ncbi:MAG: hypothetical protein LUH22_11630 [Bacteroides sp.]|nr:hypothetical protein [Bacteroides sp.]
MKKLICFIVTWFLCALSLKISSQNPPYPFFRSFLDTKMDNITIATFLPNNPSNSANWNRTNRAKLVSGLGLQLTEGKAEVGAFYIDGYFFTTKEGLIIEFEYIMKYTQPGDTALTDGICMFLVDASTTKYIGSNLKYGAEGSGFGYTHRQSNPGLGIKDQLLQITGMKGAYLGVALDQGHFKELREEGDEVRNGISYRVGSVEDAKPERHDHSSNVTVRGAAGRDVMKAKTTSDEKTHTFQEGFWGYPVLVTRHTGGSGTGYHNEAWYELDTSNGDYKQHIPSASEIIDTPFDIAGGSTFTQPTEAAYRKAIISLQPTERKDGFYITVTIQHGEKKTVVLKDYSYPLELKYRENGAIRYMGKYTTQLYYDPPVLNLKIPDPTQLVLGFMASTGFETSYTNVIKNLRITLLYAANTANDDFVDHRRGPVTIRPLDNDWGFKKEGDQVVQCSECLDLTSFRFWKDEYNCLGDQKFEYIDPGKGKWVYNPALGTTMFFPVKGFTGTASIMYDIKSKENPYNGEEFRSSLATISITLKN